MNIDRNWLVDNFLKYVAYDSQSDPESKTVPSTEKQLVLAKAIKEDCEKIGLSDVKMDQYGFVTATLPSNLDNSASAPVIGFMAHMDTSPDSSGKDIKPNIIKNYDGKDITLASGLVMSTEEFPHLKDYAGQDIITTDGTTLLGADDKAGVSEILAAVIYFLNNPDVKHGTIRIAFTPDEEIGTGMDNFDATGFGADFAYTMDAGGIGDFTYETFNAAKAKVQVTGKSVHPGSAKDIMVNAGMVASEIIERFPKNETPSTTEGYEGFYHLSTMNGGVESAVLNYIIRDHDMTKFENRKKFFADVIESVNKKYGNIVTVDIEDQYYNMAEKVNEKPICLDLAKKAYAQAGITPKIAATRGGTDGSRLSFMGIPCPNIFTGGHNAHGPFEYAVIDAMVKASEVIVHICTLAVE